MARDLKATLSVGVKVSGEGELKKLERWQIRMQLNSARMAEQAASRQIRAIRSVEQAQARAAAGAAKSAEKGAARQARAARDLDRWRMKMQLNSARMAAKTPRELGGTWDPPGSKGGGGGGRSGGFDRFLALGSKMALTGYLIAGGFRLAGRAIEGALGPVTEFQSAMAQVRIKGGFDAAATARLAAQAKYLGRTTMFAPTEAAKSQIALAASGLSEQQISANMPTVLKFAQASGMGADESSDYLVNVARQFGLDLNDAGTMQRVGSALVRTANMSTISERDLQQTLKYAGPVAREAGASLEQALAMSAILGNSGLKASQAGTGIRNLFSSFAKPKGGKLTGEMLKEIGLTRQDVMDGMKDVPTFLEVMDARMKSKGYSNQKRVALAASLFGQYGMTAAMVLERTAGTKAEGLRNGIQQMTQDVLSGTDALDRAAQIRGDTIEGRVARMNASFDTLRITIGEKLAPAASTALDSITQKLRNWDQLANTDSQLSQNITNMGAAATAALPAVVDLMGAALKLATYMGQAAEGFRVMSSTEGRKEISANINEYLGVPAASKQETDPLEQAARMGLTPGQYNWQNNAPTTSWGDFFFPDKVGERQSNTWRGNFSPAVPQDLGALSPALPPGTLSPGVMEIRVTAAPGSKAEVVTLKPPSNISVEVNQSVPP